MKQKLAPGATPVDDREGLIPKHVTTKADLNELEFANINAVIQKYFLGKLGDKKAPMDVSWFIKVHREMYGKVWKWAGKFRSTELNIGVAPQQIHMQLKQLVDNFWYWERETKMEVLEKAVRLHHGLVKIHPFKNGNGRWARLIANIYLRKSESPLIRWPEKTLQADSPFRKEYILALQKADQGNYGVLIQMHATLQIEYDTF